MLAETFVKKIYLKKVLIVSMINTIRRGIGMNVWQLILFSLVILSITSCKKGDNAGSPLSIAMGDMYYINIDNQDDYSISGTCVGDGLEVSYNIGGVTGIIMCDGGKWHATGVDLSELEDGKISVDISFTNGKKVVSASSSVIKDTVPPSFNFGNIEVPDDNTYGVGNPLSFTVTFREAVFVERKNTSPYLNLIIGSTTKSARYMMGSGTDELTFMYVLQVGDEDDNGIETGPRH